jgi:hypothetical protein
MPIQPRFLRSAFFVTSVLALSCLSRAGGESSNRIDIDFKEEAGRLTVSIDNQIAFVYQFDASVDLPHFDPFNSASGRAMTVKITDPYPHHRSFWVADERVRLAGQAEAAGFYNALYSGVEDKSKSKWPTAPFKRRVIHVEFSEFKIKGDTAEFDEKLTWTNGDVPYLDELRHYRVRALDEGEYLLDFSFQLRATYGKVTIKRDSSHYAIPYIRMNDTFNVERGGGKIVNSQRGENQQGTHDQLANWVDYSAPLDNAEGWEGLACFIHPSQKPPHLWLTRDYGTWGPRAPKGFHNTTFTIPEGKTYDQRVGLLVHQGDAESGQVAKRYQSYCDGEL